MANKLTPTDENTLVFTTGVREYLEGYPVQLYRDSRSGRLVVRAFNEATYNEVRIDLLDLMEWVKSHQDLIASLIAMAVIEQ